MLTWFLDHFDPFFWHLFGRLWVVSGTFWTIFGPKNSVILERFSTTLVILGLFWGHFGMILPSFWHRFTVVFGVVLASFRGRFGVTLFGRFFLDLLRPKRGHFFGGGLGKKMC